MLAPLPYIKCAMKGEQTWQWKCAFSLYKSLAEQYNISVEGAEYVYEWKSLDCYHVSVENKVIHKS